MPMSAALTDKLRGKMEQVTGKKVELKCSVDPSIMGGIVVKVNNEQFDTSLRTRLEELAALGIDLEAACYRVAVFDLDLYRTQSAYCGETPGECTDVFCPF